MHDVCPNERCSDFILLLFIFHTYMRKNTHTHIQSKICITLNQIYAIYYSTTIKNEDAWDFSYAKKKCMCVLIFLKNVVCCCLLEMNTLLSIHTQHHSRDMKIMMMYMCVCVCTNEREKN